MQADSVDFHDIMDHLNIHEDDNEVGNSIPTKNKEKNRSQTQKELKKVK